MFTMMWNNKTLLFSPHEVENEQETLEECLKIVSSTV